MTAASGLLPEKRSTFLERNAGSDFTDADLGRAMHQALVGLI
jgi:hypothetical protein